MIMKCKVELEYDIPEGYHDEVNKNINNIRRDITEWMLKEWTRVNITNLRVE